MNLPRTLRPIRRLKALKNLILEKLDALLRDSRSGLDNDILILEKLDALLSESRSGRDNDTVIMEMLRSLEQKTGLSHSRLFLPFEERELSYVILKQERIHQPCNTSDLPLPPPHLLLGHEDAAQFLNWGSYIFLPWHEY